MASEFGSHLKISVFGASHADCIGVEVRGLPAGEAVDPEALQAFLDRRRPGGSALTTARNEPDVPEFLSGLTEIDGTFVTTGEPLKAVIRNTDQHSSDYKGLTRTPRPSHADYTALLKYGPDVDMRGGGPFSARLTAPMCIIGGICRQILSRRGVDLGAHLQSVGSVTDEAFPLYPDKALFEAIDSRYPSTIDPAAGESMLREVEAARNDLDSVGGVIECAVTGFPAGIGGPMFDGIENELADVLFGVPAVKGIEFGSGFAAAGMRGSEHNDPFIVKDGHIATETNFSGGIQGGISNGMPIVFRVALKPTPSIAREQKTVDLDTLEETTLSIKGRHDPCVALRAVPVIEAVTAIALYDLLLGEEKADAEGLDALRAEINDINDDMLALFLRRMDVSADIAKYKDAHDLPIFQKDREDAILAGVEAKAGEQAGAARALFETLMELSKNYQRSVLEEKSEGDA